MARCERCKMGVVHRVTAVEIHSSKVQMVCAYCADIIYQKNLNLQALAEKAASQMSPPPPRA